MAQAKSEQRASYPLAAYNFRVTVDGTAYPLAPRECLYVGRGAREVEFEGGAFYLVSTPAHATFPSSTITIHGMNNQSAAD